MSDTAKKHSLPFLHLALRQESHTGYSHKAPDI
jgi:hypothetical protein